LQNNCTNDIVMVTGDLITNTVNKFTELTMQQRKGTSRFRAQHIFIIYQMVFYEHYTTENSVQTLHTAELGEVGQQLEQITN